MQNTNIRICHPSLPIFPRPYRETTIIVAHNISNFRACSFHSFNLRYGSGHRINTAKLNANDANSCIGNVYY